MPLPLNQLASSVASAARHSQDRLKISFQEMEDSVVIDFGVHVAGGIDAGLLLARLCLADLAHVSLHPADESLVLTPQLFVRTDHPVEACLMSQYAGWKIATDRFFAMGSGPMRAVAQSEELFQDLPECAGEEVAVGVLECGSLPDAGAIAEIRKGVGPDRALILAVAPTSSHAGNVQVVARSIETALHKLHELKFPLELIVSGTGCAPLPPIARNDLEGIGRTNDAILYGATVNLWVRCDDELIEELGPGVPSSSSEAHGQTFLSLFKAANHDFYALDPALFSPAVVIFHNLKSGRTFQFGHKLPTLLRESFGF
ncbi:MAG: methenyltetrahydromethanopterin cyclohydrolase [Planctomycetaceae bacterium]|nr:methenyltetrahydromethanopterin cyclohydrolase [Planctomycetaceae bacterium]